MEDSFGELGIKVSAKSVLESGEIEVIASPTENAWKQLRVGLKPSAYNENRSQISAAVALTDCGSSNMEKRRAEAELYLLETKC
jgi:hypothetical protein